MRLFAVMQEIRTSNRAQEPKHDEGGHGNEGTEGRQFGIRATSYKCADCVLSKRILTLLFPKAKLLDKKINLITTQNFVIRAFKRKKKTEPERQHSDDQEGEGKENERNRSRETGAELNVDASKDEDGIMRVKNTTSISIPRYDKIAQATRIPSDRLHRALWE
ncbi:hypothetical protein Scep_021385 [Stephania cephalantha]|uniref:Uncharacterized protein n=1 Tax=Stephania cephalantha TaxID=152367 RepID=A0AAP0F3C4_9MAGN